MYKNSFRNIGVLLGQFIAPFDFAMVTTALVFIKNDFSMDFLQLQWVMSGFAVGTAISSVTVGRLAKRFTKKKVYLIGLFFFSLLSLLIALSPNPLWLIICRSLQGVTISAILVCSYIYFVKDFFSKSLRMGLIIWGISVGLGMALGPIVSGFIIQYCSWRYIFVISFLLGVLSFLFSLFALEEEGVKTGKVEFDWLGFIFLSIGLSSLVIAIVQGVKWSWDSWECTVFHTIAALSLALFCFTEVKTKSPLIPLGLLLNRYYLLYSLANFAFLGITWGYFFLIPIFLYFVLDTPPIQIGLIMLASGGPFLLFVIPCSLLVSKIGDKPVVVLGLFLITLGVFFQTFTIFMPKTNSLIVTLVLLGIGSAMIYYPVFSRGLVTIGDTKKEKALAAMLNMRYLGCAIVFSIAGAVFQHYKNVFVDKRLGSYDIKISPNQRESIESALSNTTLVYETLRNYGIQSAGKVYVIFKQGFITGYEQAMWFLVWVGFILMILMFFGLKSKKEIAR